MSSGPAGCRRCWPAGRSAPSPRPRPPPGRGRDGITAFLVEKGMPGFRPGRHERKMGIRACPASELIFEGCEVAVANRLGGEGEGYRIALSALGEGRISIAAACTGLAQAALEVGARYLTERVAFGVPLAEQQGLRFVLAGMAPFVGAVQLLGAAGYSRENPVERYMRDAKGAQIYEGTNQIHRLIVAEHVLARVSGS